MPGIYRRGTYGGSVGTNFDDLDAHIVNMRAESDEMWPALQPLQPNPPKSGGLSGPVDTFVFDASLPEIGPGTVRGARIGCSKQARTKQLSPIPGGRSGSGWSGDAPAGLRGPVASRLPRLVSSQRDQCTSMQCAPIGCNCPGFLRGSAARMTQVISLHVTRSNSPGFVT